MLPEEAAMSTQPLRSRQTRRWLVAALAICVAVPVLLATQGCCSWCVKKCPPCTPSDSAHPFVVVPDSKGQPSSIAPVPRQKVKTGDLLLLVNGSEMAVTIKPKNVSFTLLMEGDEITLKPHEITCRTISHKPQVLTTVEFEITPWFPPKDYPGPGIDIEP